ncbi:unnamed protein product, partial [Effrenium voratum]
ARAAEHGVPCRRRPGLCSRSSWAEGQHVGPVLRVARRRKQIALWLFQAKRHPLHAGVARRAGAAQEDNSGQDRLDLEEVVAEAKRVVDNGTLKDMQVVMRKVQLTDPGKWNDLATKPELKQQLKKFVAEAALKALEEDLLLARQQQASAQRQVETAQRQVESAQRQVERSDGGEASRSSCHRLGDGGGLGQCDKGAGGQGGGPGGEEGGPGSEEGGAGGGGQGGEGKRPDEGVRGGRSRSLPPAGCVLGL